MMRRTIVVVMLLKVRPRLGPRLDKLTGWISATRETRDRDHLPLLWNRSIDAVSPVSHQSNHRPPTVRIDHLPPSIGPCPLQWKRSRTKRTVHHRRSKQRGRLESC